ncbi:MAG: TIM barrel protein [Methanomassiliicoccales archaeon]
MPRVGPAGYPMGSKGAVDAVERAAAMGFSAMEVQFVRQARMAEDKARQAGKKADELGVLLSAHAPYYINLNSPNREIRVKSVEWIMRSARICHQLGARILVLHAASYAKSRPEDCTVTVRSALQSVRASMEEEGIEDVVLGLETMGKMGSWGTLEEIEAVVKEVPGTIPVIDFAHIHARSQGGLRSRGDFGAVLKKVKKFYPGRLHCHFSCIEYTSAGEKRHLPLNAGSPDYRLAVPLFKKMDEDLTLISETPPPEEGAKAMMWMLEAQG